MENDVEAEDQDGRPAVDMLYCATANEGGVAAQMQADPKKQGKAKKPESLW